MKKMKKILGLCLFAFFIHNGFCAGPTDAEDLVKTAETYKTIVLTENKGQPFTAEENSFLKDIYDNLEKEIFTASTRDGTLKCTVGEYDMEEALWPLRIEGSFFDGFIQIDQEIELLYSMMMERDFIPEKNMTEYQRRDYEYYVTEYENKFRSGEEAIYIELDFSIQHWIKPSQYRFKPIELRIFKIAKTNREIYSRKDMNIDFWICEPNTEYRSQKEIDADMQKAKKTTYAENRAKEREKEEDHHQEEKIDHGRRAVYFSLETFREHLGFNEIDISKLTLNTFDAALTFGLGKYFFLGAELCFDVEHINKSNYSFGLLAGAGIKFAKVLRPYIISGAAFGTDDKARFKAGGGLDFVIGHLMLTAGYAFNWNKTFGNHENDDTRDKFHSIAFGIGFCW